MGNKSSLMLQDEEINQISSETGFSSSQIEKLYSRFAHLDRANCGSLTKNDLLSIPELAINPLCDRLIQMFFDECTSGDERINFKQFVKVLAIFKSASSITAHNNRQENSVHNSADINDTKIMKRLSKEHSPLDANQEDPTSFLKNSRSDDGLRRKLQFVFRIYDADNDKRISFKDLRSILKMMVGNYIEDVQLNKIANRAFLEVDEDNDGYLDFNEFCKVFSAKDLDNKLRVKFFN